MRSEEQSMSVASRGKKPMFDDKHQKLLNGVNLGVAKALGFNQRHLRTNAYSLDESKLTYVCGKNIVVYDLLSETQKVFQRPSEEQTITAFGCFKTLYSEDYVIYAAKSNHRNVSAYVGIINVWKNNVRSYSVQNLESEECVTDVLFLLQGAYFVLLSQHDTSRITIFNVENDREPRVTQSFDFSVQSMFAFDSNSQDFYVNNATEIYQVHFDLSGLAADKLKIKLESDEKIACVRGMNGNEPILVYATDKGYLYFGRLNIDGSYKCEREDLGTFETLDSDGKIITARRRPSIVCCNDYNILIGYELLEELTLIKVSGINFQKRTVEKICFSCPYLHKVMSMNFSEENSGVCMVVQLKEGDKEGISMRLRSKFLQQKGEQSELPSSLANHNLPPGKIVPVVFNFLLYNTLLETYRSPMNQVLSATVFSKPILGIGICPFKKIVLLLSQKKVVALRFDAVASTALTKLFLWECEFGQQPLSLDMHPSNFEVAIAFRDGVKTYVAMNEGLRSTNFCYSMKQCESVKYSQYGHFLAVSSGNLVLLLNPYSNQLLETVQVRTNSPLREIRFVDHDRSLFLHANNGTISVVNLQTKAQLDLNNKMKIIAAVYDPMQDLLVMSYSEYFTKFYKERGTLEYGTMMTYNHRNTCFLVSNEFRTIFMGNSLGAVHCYEWPFQDYHSFDENFTCTSLHQSAVTHMKITTDLAFLITGAEDGSVFISKIQHYCDGMLTTDSEIINVIRTHNRDYAMLYSMERISICSVSSEYLREEKVIQLEADKADYDCDYAESISQKKHEIRLRIEDKELQQKQLKNKDSEQYASQIQKLQDRKKVVQKEIADIVSTTEVQKSSSAVATDDKLRQLYLLNEKLSKDKEELISSNLKSLTAQTNRLNGLLKQMEEEQNGEYNEMNGRCKSIENDMIQERVKFNALEKEECDQFNQYKTKVIDSLEERRLKECERGEDLRKQLNRTTSENVRYETRRKELKAITEEIEQEISQLQSEQKQYERQIREIGQVLEQKDALINDEERKAKQYLKNNIVETNKELYLTYRMKELEEKNKAMENHLEGLEQRQELMYQEFLEEALTTKRIKDEIQQAKNNLQVYNAELKNKQHSSYESGYHYDIFKARVSMLLHNHTDGLEVEFEKLLREFQRGLPANSDHQNIAAEQRLEELKHRRDALIINAQKNKQLTETNDSIKKNILIKANYETINLTSECNELRFERNRLLEKLKEVQERMRKATEQYEAANSNRNLQALVEIFPAELNISTIPKKKSKPATKLPFEKYTEQNRLKRLNLALEKNKLNPRRSESEKIDILNMLRVKELTSAPSGPDTAKPHDITKATKPSFLEESNSFLPPIHSRELSTLSGGVAQFMNQSLGMDSTHLHSIEQTRILKESYRTSKRNSHVDPK